MVPAWANWEEFDKLKENGLIMYGQMTAGSWIYIGTQGILQGTYETLAEVARHMHCSREYCRQVVQRALRKLRKTGIQNGILENVSNETTAINNKSL